MAKDGSFIKDNCRVLNGNLSLALSSKRGLDILVLLSLSWTVSLWAIEERISLVMLLLWARTAASFELILVSMVTSATVFA